MLGAPRDSTKDRNLKETLFCFLAFTSGILNVSVDRSKISFLLCLQSLNLDISLANNLYMELHFKRYTPRFLGLI